MPTSALTITIPTFQRQAKLLARVSELLPQMAENDRLVIIDNGSKGFEPLAHAQLRDPRVQVLVNNANIGGNANIAKCFGECLTPWMWLLSDDDPVLPGAMRDIRAEIAAFPDACFIGFLPAQSAPSRPSSRACTGLDEFIAHNDGFEHTLLMSNCVFNLDALRGTLSFAHTAIFTNGQHLAPVFKALERGATAVYSSHRVIEWGEPELNEGWSRAAVYHLLQLPTILDDGAQAARLRRLIADGLPPPEKFVAQLCYMRVRHGDDWRIVPFGRQVVHDYLRGRGPVAWMRSWLLRRLISFPSVFLFLFGTVYRVAKKKALRDFLQDRKFSLYL